MHSISFILESSLLFAKHFLHQNIFCPNIGEEYYVTFFFSFWNPSQMVFTCSHSGNMNLWNMSNMHENQCTRFVHFHNIYSNISFWQKKKETIWCLLRLSRIWKILVNLFNSLLNWKSRQNIWNNLEKSSKIGQGKKGLVSSFLCFCQNLISARNTDHRLNSSLRFF